MHLFQSQAHNYSTAMAEPLPAFRFLVALLQMIGIVHPSCRKINRYIARAWGLILFISTAVFTSQKLVSIFVSPDMSDRATHIRDSDTMGLLLVIQGHLYRCSDRLFSLMSRLSVTEDHETAEAVAATSRRTAKLSKVLIADLIVLASLIMVAPLGKSEMSIDGGSGTWKIVQDMPMPVWYPVEVSSFSIHSFLYVLQSLPVASELLVYLTFFCMFPTVCMQLSTQFHLLSNKMKSCKDGAITKLIQKHQLILGLVRDFNADVKSVMVWYVMFAVLCMGTTSLEIITVAVGSPKQMAAVLYLISQTVGLLLCCRAGEVVTEAGEKFFEATVFCPWTEMDLEYRKLMITLTRQAARPVKLKAGSLYDLSLPLYSELMKTWYRLFNILQKLT